LTEPIIVVGHRNPDNDSISSAVAYAHLKNILDSTQHYAPYRLGPLPPESEYLLNRFNIPIPQILTHVHSRVLDVMTPQPLQVLDTDTMRQAAELLKARAIRTLVVSGKDGLYRGIIDTQTFANLYLAELDEVEPTTATRFTTLARPISDFLVSDVPVLEPDDLLSEAREKVLASSLRQAVVLDAARRCVGIVTRTDLARTPRRRVILVDHNEVSQAVNGILEAEVVEVVDHHRIGDIQTHLPIPFINLPLGSTASIVTTEFQRYAVPLEEHPTIAALLLSALLTDTVLLKSPTTTARDRELAALLARAAGLDIETFGRELLEARFSGQDGSVESIVLADSKEFVLGDTGFVISQYETIDTERILTKQPEILAFLETMVAQRSLEFALLLVTDITREGSQFIVAGKPQLVEHAFNIRLEGASTWVPGILSRKKQVVPRLLG